MHQASCKNVIRIKLLKRAIRRKFWTLYCCGYCKHWKEWKLMEYFQPLQRTWPNILTFMCDDAVPIPFSICIHRMTFDMELLWCIEYKKLIPMTCCIQWRWMGISELRTQLWCNDGCWVRISCFTLSCRLVAKKEAAYNYKITNYLILL